MAVPLDHSLLAWRLTPMTQQIPAVVLGVNYYIGLSAVRALGRENIPVIAMDHDPQAYGFSSKYIQERVLIPRINQDGEEAVITFLIDFVKGLHYKPVLIPSADEYAVMISKHSQRLQDYFLFPELPQGLIADLVNKRTLYQYAEALGIPAPKTFYPRTRDAIDDIKGQVAYPCLIKPELSHEFIKIFRRKAFTANDSHELADILMRVDEAGQSVMVQEIIPGPDSQMYTYDAYFDQKGEPVKVFTNRKKRQFPVYFGASTLTETVNEPRIIELGETFLKKLGYRGIVEIEFKLDPRRDTFYMIEINPRVTNFNSAILDCGINMPAALYYDMLGEPLNSQQNTKDGHKFVDLYDDLRSAYAYFKMGELSLSSWLSSYRGPLSHAIYDPGDLKPLLSFTRQLGGRAVNKILRGLGRKE